MIECVYVKIVNAGLGHKNLILFFLGGGGVKNHWLKSVNVMHDFEKNIVWG